MKKALLAAVVCVFLAAGAATGAGQTQTGVVSVYLKDVKASSSALTKIGGELESVPATQSGYRWMSGLRRQLSKFDRHTYAMSRYRIANRNLDRQRARLARTAPRMTTAISDLLDAVTREDRDRIDAVAPKALRAIAAFEKAAG